MNRSTSTIVIIVLTIFTLLQRVQIMTLSWKVSEAHELAREDQKNILKLYQKLDSIITIVNENDSTQQVIDSMATFYIMDLYERSIILNDNDVQIGKGVRRLFKNDSDMAKLLFKVYDKQNKTNN